MKRRGLAQPDDVSGKSRRVARLLRLVKKVLCYKLTVMFPYVNNHPYPLLLCCAFLTFLPNTPSSPSSRGTMARNCQRLWRDVLSTPKGANAVRTLAEILTDKEGKTFISHLEREDAVLCIEVLNRVSPNHFSLSPPQTVSSGHCRGQPQNC